MKIYIPHDFDNWNTYIYKERINRYIANSVKQQEAKIIKQYTNGLKWEGSYPVNITITKYFKNKRQDLDNVRIKGVLDGLVKCGVIKNDNLNCINKITLQAEFSEKVGLVVEINTKLKKVDWSDE